MIAITRIFSFETAHAIYGYAGACRNIHGHSYTLHVTITATEEIREYIPDEGILFDFTDLKKLVNERVIEKLDHRLLLSTAFLKKHPGLYSAENLFEIPWEPTAENLLIWIAQQTSPALPAHVKLGGLKLYETKNSYAVWHP